MECTIETKAITILDFLQGIARKFARDVGRRHLGGLVV